MTKPVIEIRNLSKQYTIGERASYGNFREEIMQTLTSPFRRLTSHSSQTTHDENKIWALKNVSFKVNEGEVIGIIGRNGAGKSTLLKILSRITEPTEGEVRMRGRVGSLLEVGTGFHPELTGRENILLNGALLGMRRQEINAKFDEIVAFAEIEKFLDTPVKRYSSGMQVRLAFAVAAHLEPEILIVDEVLAVGDAAFQKKCLGKMDDVAKRGRTVLFVSHNLQAIRNLCPRSILLNNGEVLSDDSTERTLRIYSEHLRNLSIDAKTAVSNETVRRGSGQVRFTDISVEDINGDKKYIFSMGDTIRFRLSYKVFQDIRELSVSVALRSGLTNEIITSARHLISSVSMTSGKEGTVIIEFPDVFIRPGEYPIYYWMGDYARTKPALDVVDNLTAPIVIKHEEGLRASSGYFSIPSTMTIVEKKETKNA